MLGENIKFRNIMVGLYKEFLKFLYSDAELAKYTAIGGIMKTAMDYPIDDADLENLSIFQKSVFGGMYFLVFYAFFETMPDTYSEAAEIDGANYYTILLRIILPLAGKMIATVFLIVFVNYWNDYQTALVHMPTHPTLAYGVYRIAHEVSSGDLANIPTRISVCMMLAVPILIVFVIFKDKIMGNISIGGIKG